MERNLVLGIRQLKYCVKILPISIVAYHLKVKHLISNVFLLCSWNQSFHLTTNNTGERDRTWYTVCNKPFIIVLYFSLFLFLFLLKNERAVLGLSGQEKLAKVQLTKTSRQLAPNEILIWILFIIQCGVDYSKNCL